MSITTTDYAGDYIYENGALKFIHHAEGYLQPNGAGGFEYVYQYKDHLGNVRLSYSDTNGDGVVDVNEIIEESNYYPFGLKHKGYNNVVNGTENTYQTFLGQEINKELGLNWLTFRHRNYMPEIGRFFGVDPISEDYLSITNYQFAHNNPVWKIEIEGLEGVITTPGAMDIINEGFSKPNSWQGHVTGFLMGIGNAGRGMYDAVTNPMQTLNTLTTLADPNGGRLERVQAGLAVAEDVNKAFNGNGLERGEVLGRYTTEIFLGKGLGKGLSALKGFKGYGKKFTISTNEIRFSQQKVNGLDDIVESMRKNGWQGDPIDIVEMKDGLTTIDNTRLLAAHETGIDAQVIIHKADDLLPPSMSKRFTHPTKKGIYAKTWGEAVQYRIQNQNSRYRNTNPNGSQVIHGN